MVPGQKLDLLKVKVQQLEYNKYSYNDKPNTYASVSYRLKQVDL